MKRIFNPAQWQALFNVDRADLPALHAFGASTAIPALDEALATFYARLAEEPEFSHFFFDMDVLDHVRHRQHHYWTQFWSADVAQDYIDSRTQVGRVHADIKLSLRVYFAGVGWFMAYFSTLLPADQHGLHGVGTTMRRLAAMDTAIVVGAYETHAQDSLEKLSVPVMSMWPGVVLIPVVGVVDTERGADILKTVVSTSRLPDTKVVIIDTSGMPAITADRDILLVDMFKAVEERSTSEVIVTGMLAMWMSQHQHLKSYTKITAATQLSEALMTAAKLARLKF